MARKKVKKRRVSHNPSLKATLRKRGKRLVHGYETTSVKKKRRKKESKWSG